MEKPRRLCPGVELQILRLTEQKKTELSFSHGAVLLFCIGGKLRFSAGGRRITLHAGLFCLLEEDIRLALRPELPQGHFEGFSLFLDANVADTWSKCSLGVLAPDFSAVLSRLDRFGYSRALSAGVRGEHIIRELYETAEGEWPAFSVLKLAELFLLLEKGPVQPKEEAYLPRGQESLIRHLRDHLVSDELHYSSLQALADEHGVSVSFLQKRFKQVYGMPVYQYLKLYRLEKAAAALLGTKRSVTRIALDAGYTNPAKFTEAFRKHYGLPPSEYRRGNKTDDQNR